MKPIDIRSIISANVSPFFLQSNDLDSIEAAHLRDEPIIKNEVRDVLIILRIHKECHCSLKATQEYLVNNKRIILSLEHQQKLHLIG